MEKLNIKQKLLLIQSHLNVPKNQRNDFGKYNYRSSEDILENVKPLLLKYKTTLRITDTIENIGERYYIKATAILSDLDSDNYIDAVGYAREANDKKGMDDSQITGACSSYARKYALNGLFLIDDVKDADVTQGQKQDAPQASPAPVRQTKTPVKGSVCENCKTSVTEPVRAYCVESGKFGGKVLCMKCQKATAPTQSAPAQEENQDAIQF
jgi:hypothetical protein